MPFDPAPPPPTALGQYRILSPKCGLRVSPLCLGGMSFGDAWNGMMGKTNKTAVFELLDEYRQAGGNFIDLANMYQDGQAEEWVGEWMEARDCRDEMVIATKYSSSYRNHGEERGKIVPANFGGNNAKSMRSSLDNSLKKLRTTYIDIFYVHVWTYDTSIEEVMTYLNDLVLQGKVTYLGVSDTPAWIVSKANQFARDHGLRQFVIYQGRYSPLNRDMERDVFPMCQSEGMAMHHWGVLGQGSFNPDLPNSGKSDRMVMVANEAALTRVRAVLKSIAEAKGKQVSMANVAVAWSIAKSPHTYPIIGMRSVSSLKANIAALEIKLSESEIHAIDDAAAGGPMDRGWPNNFVAPDITHRQLEGPGDMWAVRMECTIVKG